MKKSKYDGQRIVHIDGAEHQHSGVIVGQSDDGKRVYVQSDQKFAPDTQWHFTVAMNLVPAMLKNTKK